MSLPDKKFCEVNGYQMAYVETGSGDPIVFLHGNPTSSYLWRNIVPGLQSRGRCIAPDLIGMGDSDKLNNSGVDSYRFEEHAEFLDGLLECAGVTENVTLVIHDWGSALGFWWAFRNQAAVKAIAYGEAIVAPIQWDDFDLGFVELFTALRTPGVGETLVLENNAFIEQVLPSAILRNLTEEEMAAYRAPYLEPGESRRPMLTWPREVPINGTPADVVNIVDEYSQWMASNNLPKLLIRAEPGVLGTGRLLEFVRTWKNQTEVTVSGSHFFQEDSPQEVSDAINQWLDDTFEVSSSMTNTTSGSGRHYSAPSGNLHVVLFVFVMLFNLFSK